MAGVFAPYSLDGADVPAAGFNPNALQLVQLTSPAIPVFKGDPAADRMSAREWVELLMRYRRRTLAALDDLLFVNMIRSKLGPNVQRRLEGETTDSPGALLSAIRDLYPHGRYQQALHERILSGAAYVGCASDNICAQVARYLTELAEYSPAVSILATSLKKMLPDTWRRVGQNPFSMTMEEFVAVLQLVAADL
ncbi:hypothetical protein IWQ56_001841, partial [Coemansia nantahalensis]